MNHQRDRIHRDHGKWREILDGIEGWIGRQVRARRMGGVSAQYEAVAVRGGPCHLFAADVAAGARAVVHDDGLTDVGRELLADDATHRVGRGARRVGHHQLDGRVRVGLGQQRARGQQGQGEGGQCKASQAFRDHAVS